MIICRDYVGGRFGAPGVGVCDYGEALEGVQECIHRFVTFVGSLVLRGARARARRNALGSSRRERRQASAGAGLVGGVGCKYAKGDWDIGE